MLHAGYVQDTKTPLIKSSFLRSSTPMEKLSFLILRITYVYNVGNDIHSSVVSLKMFRQQKYYWKKIFICSLDMTSLFLYQMTDLPSPVLLCQKHCWAAFQTTARHVMLQPTVPLKYNFTCTLPNQMLHISG